MPDRLPAASGLPMGKAFDAPDRDHESGDGVDRDSCGQRAPELRMGWTGDDSPPCPFAGGDQYGDGEGRVVGQRHRYAKEVEPAKPPRHREVAGVGVGEGRGLLRGRPPKGTPQQEGFDLPKVVATRHGHEDAVQVGAQEDHALPRHSHDHDENERRRQVVESRWHRQMPASFEQAENQKPGQDHGVDGQSRQLRAVPFASRQCPELRQVGLEDEKAQTTIDPEARCYACCAGGQPVPALVQRGQAAGEGITARTLGPGSPETKASSALGSSAGFKIRQATLNRNAVP